MGMRKSTIVAFLLLAGVSAPVGRGVSFAQAPGAMAPAPAPAPQMVSTLSPDDKAALEKKLKAAKKHDKIARAGWSQEPLTQAGYDKKIEEINALLAKMKSGEDFPLSDAEKAVKSPGTAPY